MKLAGAGAHFLLFDHALISDSLMARPARGKGGGLEREDLWEANREKGRAMKDTNSASAAYALQRA
jgi:hypothetical protein